MAVDELQAAGVERMDDEAIEGFLDSQKTGVLGLPGDPPYLLPMSYGYDGEDRLFFSFFLGPTSQKEELADGASQARFLVYNADTMFAWDSVLLTGSLEPLPEDEWEAVTPYLEAVWRPTLFDAEQFSRGARIYTFDIDDRSGLRHTGLPPGFRREDQVSE